MRVSQAAIAFLLFAAGFWGTARGQLTKAQIEQRHRELRALHERNMAAHRSGRGSGHFDPSQARGGSASASPAPRGFSTRPTSPQAPPFNVSAAPPPDESLRKFFAAAKEARSMEELLVYLPLAEQRVLEERQANYDPKVAADNRAWRKKQNPDIDERTQTFLSNPPYVNELNWHQGVAKKFLDVLSVKVEGNKATIEISTTGGGTVNGTKFPYGTATVEMIGEGSAWKFHVYKDSNVVYLHPPRPKGAK